MGRPVLSMKAASSTSTWPDTRHRHRAINPGARHRNALAGVGFNACPQPPRRSLDRPIGLQAMPAT